MIRSKQKDTIIFDTVDGHISGIRSANFQISESSPDTGQLITVAVSRAKRRLIILANLDLLRRTLPHTAFMRKIFETAITAGNVISSETLFHRRLYPTTQEHHFTNRVNVMTHYLVN